LAGSDDRKLVATLRDGAPASEKSVMVASNKPYAPTFFDNRPMSEVPRPPERPFRVDGAQQIASLEPEADEASVAEAVPAARPRMAEAALRAPALDQAQPSSTVSPVSAYAPTRYDSRAGFMSGRGLY
jgi:rare lipoprotein A